MAHSSNIKRLDADCFLLEVYFLTKYKNDAKDQNQCG